MCRQVPLLAALTIVALSALTGCQPQQPSFLFKHVDGDLDHYKGVATDIEYPDVEADRLSDASDAQRPFSIANNIKKEIWDLTLEEAVELALRNNKVMRDIGGQVQGAPDFILRNLRSFEFVPTIYDPAMAETNPRTSAEAALSAFDAQFSSSLTWEKRDTPQNVDTSGFIGAVFPAVTKEDLGTFQARLSKVTATGGQFALTHNVNYQMSNSPTRAYPSDWNVNLVAEWRQPLLQGAGVQFNRIAGPGATPGLYSGVMLNRISTDIALADFEASVRNLVSDVETAYWELYFEYRSLDAVKAGLDSAAQTWRKTETLHRVSSKGGEADKEAQARQQYYLFRSTTEQSLNRLYVTESKLRYLLGLAATDGRLIRPKDEPTTAKVVFDWCEVLNEGLVRSVELREVKWLVKRRELELIAAKNFLLPKLDFVSQYRWLGLGNRLDGANALNIDDFALGPPFPDSNAYRTMTDGNFQEWQTGLQMSLPLGFRREMMGVRNAQLAIARDRAKLQEAELELSHQLAFAVREMEANHVLSHTDFNRRVAAQREVEAVAAAYENDTVTFDVLLQSQQNLARAESDYYRALVDYNKSISQVHYRKGSLLEYNGVYLAEGPWPAKAYFDATRRARAREASTYLDYGFTQPRVISRGPIDQMPGGSAETGQSETAPAAGQPELVPTPEPQTMKSSTPAAPIPEPQASKAGGRKASDEWLVKAETEKGTGLTSRSGPTKVRSAPVASQPWGLSPIPAAAAAGRTVDRQIVPAGWTIAEKDSSNESGANPATATVDRPASGWKGVQH